MQTPHNISGLSDPAGRVVFLVDVDNTLLDNDRFFADLSRELERSFGTPGRERYWALYEERRKRLEYADYLGALQDFRAGAPAAGALLELSGYLLDYPFETLLYPRALEVIAHLRTLGTVVVLSDGDVVFQPRKIRRGGIWRAVAGEVLICVHKQQVLEQVQRHYPAGHYVAVDDKPGLLGAMKKAMGERLSTVFVRQGHYARQGMDDSLPAPDLAIESIAALLDTDPALLSLADCKPS